MKKVILSMALLAGVVFSSQAQTEQGKIIVGGSVSYSTDKSDAVGAKSTYDFSILPSVGYFVADNIAVGTGIGYNSSKNYSGQTQIFAVSPFGRYYLPVAEKFHFFGQLSVPMGFGSVKDVDADLNVGSKLGTATSIGVDLSPGFAFFPSSKIGIEFSFNGISYQNNKVEDADGNKVTGAGGGSNFSIGTDFFSPRIGVQFHF